VPQSERSGEGVDGKTVRRVQRRNELDKHSPTSGEDQVVRLPAVRRQNPPRALDCGRDLEEGVCAAVRPDVVNLAAKG